MTDTVTGPATNPTSTLLTFLIADVRGYTRFTLEHGDEAAARLATRFAELTEEIVGRHDGHVIELRGDEALAVFASPRNALRAAVALQDAFLAASTDEMPLRAGIGLDAGEVIPVKGGYRGAALNLAARLCSFAGPGEVLASETVANLARKIAETRYVDRGAVDLKGFAEPVRIVQVVAAGEASPIVAEQTEPIDASGHMPIGGFLGSLPAGPLIGRDAELQRALSSIDEALAEGRTILLAGEPGAGKTRLGQEITIGLRDRGFLIGSGRCYEAEQAVPYYSFLDALSTLFAAAPPDIRLNAGSRWPYLGVLLPDDVGVTEVPAGGRDEQQRVFRSVAGFLQALAATRPVALLLDDLHWADSATLRLLTYLSRQTRDAPVFILGTFRDVEVNRKHPLEDTLRELLREQLVDRIDLRRLDESATRSLVAAIVGAEEISEEFGRVIHARTEGNPFFVHQVIRVLAERGDIYRANGRWERKDVEEIDIPESVRAVVGQRVDRLPEAAQETLAEASVLGQTFTFDDLAGLSELDEDEIEQALDDGASAGLIRTDDGERYAFDHALTQQVLYGEIPPRRKRKLHRAAGEAIERLPERKRKGRVAELAWHFVYGDDDAKALSYSIDAGDAAESVYANREAEIHYRTALELTRDLDEDRATIDIQERLGNVLVRQGRYGEAIEILRVALDEARSRTDRDAEYRVAATLGQAHFRLGTREEGIAELTRVLDHAAPDNANGLAPIYAALGHLYWASGQYQQALDSVDRAIALARESGDRRLEAEAVGRRALVLQFIGQQHDARDAFVAAINLAETVDDLGLLGTVLNNFGLTIQCYAGDFAGAIETHLRQLELARKTDDPSDIVFALGRLSESYEWMGDWDTALRYAEELSEYTQALGPSRFGGFRVKYEFLRLLRGNEERRRWFESAAVAARDADQGDTLIWIECSLGAVDLLDGNPEAARRRMTALLDGPSFEAQFRTGAEAILAQAYLELGDPDSAEPLIEANVNNTALLYGGEGGTWLSLQGRLRVARGDRSGALDEFLSALAVPGSTAWERANTLASLGELERDTGDLDAARSHWQEALILYRQLGIVKAIEQIEKRLASVDSIADR